MRQIITNVYKFEELSPAARDRAWEHGPDFSQDYDSEYISTLLKFEDVFNINVWDYRVGHCTYGPHFKYFKAGRADDAPAGDPIRLATYIWNNFADDISKGKYYSTRGQYIDGKYTYKYRHSKIQLEMDNCPLTGCAYDCDILQPVIDCLHYKKFYNDIDELLNDCLTAFFRSWDAEKEYLSSYEYFAEYCEENDIEFYETGEMYK